MKSIKTIRLLMLVSMAFLSAQSNASAMYADRPKDPLDIAAEAAATELTAAQRAYDAEDSGHGAFRRSGGDLMGVAAARLQRAQAEVARVAAEKAKKSAADK